MERKLAAILAADVVGYSALMERDEAGTFNRLRAHRKELFEPEIVRHHGHVFKLMGDGLLAEFSSVVDAVECAVVLQRSMAERNASVEEDRRIQVRIGINLGEVIVEGDDRYGEGVNIAARLQQLADAGGICVSEKVSKEVEKKLAFGFEPMGEQHLKNIAEPVLAYRVKLDGRSSPAQRWSRQFAAVRRPRLVAVAMILLALGMGAGAWFGVLRPAPLSVAASGVPSIAVLPFANMSGDPAQDYLGPGVAEQIITVLSTFPTIRVVSRMSSFIYDKPVKVQQVAQDLDVSYVLEGSVRKAADKIRVTAQLVDATTGDHIWVNSYDEAGDNVVALQEEVANKIYASLAGLRGEIRKQEQGRAWQKSAPSLEEYDYYLRGHQLFFHFTADGNAQARKIWQEGLAKFPDSSLLRLKLAWTYQQDIASDRSEDVQRDIELAWKLAKEAEAAEDKSRLETWLSHWLMATLYQWHDGNFERSVIEAETAIQMVPNDPFSRADLAGMLANAGKPDQAIDWLEEVIRQDPKGPDWYIGNLASAYYLAGRPADAVAEFEKMQKPWTLYLAAAWVRLGKLDEARAIIAKFMKENPGYTIRDEAVWPSKKQPQLKEPLLTAYLDDLRKAGLQEK
ncbi:adenylate/guanylate cyclase domain-containing protein [Inquilinus limosus]|uniref:adenylate/guanylate cyclase domain-containing protein n=1 Tax=Inquilinus limosus TaxID=171674 RepID=UPI003F1590CD